MTQLPGKSITDLTLVRLLPNMMTLGAICAGMTAIRFAVLENYTTAVSLILLAAILDGLDGRVARMVGSDSQFGLELDSLGDFLNFGVAPAVIVYFWSLHDMGAFGWSTALAFAICCVLRLARFNVIARSPETSGPCTHFTGVPAPAGAFLALAPMFLAFAFVDRPALPPLLVCLYLLGVGLLMVCRAPTPSLKGLRIPQESRVPMAFGGLLLVVALIAFEWITLLAMSTVYLMMVLRSYIIEWRKASETE